MKKKKLHIQNRIKTVIKQRIQQADQILAELEELRKKNPAYDDTVQRLARLGARLMVFDAARENVAVTYTEDIEARCFHFLSPQHQGKLEVPYMRLVQDVVSIGAQTMKLYLPDVMWWINCGCDVCKENVDNFIYNIERAMHYEQHNNSIQ